MNVTQRRPGVAVTVALHAHDIGHGYHVQMRSRATGALAYTTPKHASRICMHHAHDYVRNSCIRTLTPEGAVIFRDLARAR
eukprot:3067497-Pleurochrysis_carterae.AAC.1